MKSLVHCLVSYPDPFLGNRDRDFFWILPRPQGFDLGTLVSLHCGPLGMLVRVLPLTLFVVEDFRQCTYTSWPPIFASPNKVPYTDKTPDGLSWPYDRPLGLFTFKVINRLVGTILVLKQYPSVTPDYKLVCFHSGLLNPTWKKKITLTFI